jgi:hypothetical protein
MKQILITLFVIGIVISFIVNIITATGNTYIANADAIEYGWITFDPVITVIGGILIIPAILGVIILIFKR